MPSVRNVLDRSFESRTGVDESGRLRRPFAAAIVGSMVSFGVGVLTVARAGGRGTTPIAFVIVFLVGTLLSIFYAIIGAHVNKNAANKFLSIVGMLLVLGGTAYVVYLVKSSPY